MNIEADVHTMPLATLRVLADEARRLIAQAQEIARSSFESQSDGQGPASEGADAARRVGQLLDAAQRLLPGMAPLIEERPASSRMKPADSGWRRVTLRGGAERALETLERSEILEGVIADAQSLVSEIERRSSSVFRAAEPVISADGASRRL